MTTPKVIIVGHGRRTLLSNLLGLTVNVVNSSSELSEQFRLSNTLTITCPDFDANLDQYYSTSIRPVRCSTRLQNKRYKRSK